MQRTKKKIILLCIAFLGIACVVTLWCLTNSPNFFTSPKEEENNEEGSTLLVDFPTLHNFLVAAKKEVAHLKNQSLVFFVGDTGAGKTTTILYLLGRKLGLKNEADNPQITKRKIDLSDEKDEFFGKIGHGYSSQTGFPMSYKGVNQDLAYVDFPGFFDTNGVEKDFCTAVTMRDLAETNKVKAVVFVIPWDDISGARAKGIKTIIDTFYNTFPNFAKDKGQIMPSVFLAFTKTAATTEEIVKELKGLKKNAQKRIKSLSKLTTARAKQQKTQLQRELAVYEYITQRKLKEHFLFPDPLGKDSEKVRKAILKKIKNAPVIDSGQFGLALNESSKTILKVALEREAKGFNAAIRRYEKSVETGDYLAKELERQNNILRDKQALQKSAQEDQERTVKTIAELKKEQGKNLKEKTTQKKAVEAKMPTMGAIVILKEYIDFDGKQYIDEGIATYYTLQEEVTD